MSFSAFSSSIRVLFWFSNTATRFSRHLTYSFFFLRHSRAASLERERERKGKRGKDDWVAWWKHFYIQAHRQNASSAQSRGSRCFHGCRAQSFISKLLPRLSPGFLPDKTVNPPAAAFGPSSMNNPRPQKHSDTLIAVRCSFDLRTTCDLSLWQPEKCEHQPPDCLSEDLVPRRNQMSLFFTSVH